MTATEEAARVRAAYKKLGWGPRMIGVRAKYFSMGSEVIVTIKDPRVREKKAREIAQGAEHIHRCEITGEILGGGNRYVSVTYSPECREVLGRRWVEQLRAALAKIPEDDRRRLEPIEGAGGALVGRESGYDARIWMDGRAGMHFYAGNEAGLIGGAFHLACALDGGEGGDAG